MLQRSIPISGHEGGGNGSHGETEFGFDGGFLTVRTRNEGFDTTDKPGPGWILEAEGDEFYHRYWASAEESIYRYREGRLEAFRFEEYRRVEPGTDPAVSMRDGFRPVWPHRDGSPPRPGEWLKRLLSLEDGEKQHPLIGSLDVTN